MRILSLNLFALLLFTVQGCQSISTGRVNSSDRSHSIEVLLPKNAPSIKSDYSANRSVSQTSWRLRPHRGIDIVAPRGHPVLAPLDGVIYGVGYQDESGQVIHLDHQNPNGTIIFTSYLHLSRIDVEFGDKVTRGQKIGEVGQTGTKSDNINHLHFVVNWGRDNPHRYWIGGEGVIECFDPDKTYHPKNNAFLTYPVACIDLD